MQTTVYVHGKRRSRSSVVASAAGQRNSLLFIVDDISAKRFLVDTGASVSVFPASHKDRHGGVRTPSLVAANGTNIATYGTREMSLSLDRRNYTWPFIIADVRTPLLGADFLQANALLVDLQSRRLTEDRSSHLNCGRYCRSYTVHVYTAPPRTTHSRTDWWKGFTDTSNPH